MQVDFKEDSQLGDGPGVTTEAVREAISSRRKDVLSAANWLATAADALDSATRGEGTGAGQYTLTSAVLNGEQISSLTQGVIADKCVKILRQEYRSHSFLLDGEDNR